MCRLAYRNFGDHESLVVNHTLDADGGDHAGIRWYEIRDPNGTPTNTITPTPTISPAPSARIVGHLTWQGIA